MIKYHSFKIPHILVSLTIFIVGVFLGIYNSRAENLIITGGLTGIFPTIQSNYSSIYFNYGGNDFMGMFFWTSGTNLSSPETINISGSSQSISCSQKINGLYFNTQRGLIIWPLDTGNRQKLIDSGYTIYNIIQITGGFYTNCTGAGGGYIPKSNEIYGQITHTRSGTNYHLIAGVNYNFTGNSISGTTFGPTLYITGNISTGNTATGHIFDNYGGIGNVGVSNSGTLLIALRLGTTGGLCQSFTMTSPVNITQGTNATFTCYGSNSGGNIISGYKLNIYTSNNPNPIYESGFIMTSATSYTRNVNTLNPGSYMAECVIIGVGEGNGSTCDNPAYFTVTSTSPQNSGNACGFQGNIAIVPIPGITVRRALGDMRYTKSTGGVDIQIWSTLPSYYVISGTEMTNVITGYYNYVFNQFAPIVNTGKIYLTTGDGVKTINSRFSTGGCTYQAPAKYITLDLLPPTSITSLSPNTGGICYIGENTFSWSGAYDSGVGIAGYYYKISNNPLLTTTILQGTTPNTFITINASALGTGYFSGTYYRSVQAIDALGQTGSAMTGSFNVGLQYCSNSGNIMIHGLIPRIRNAELNKEYISDPFTVNGLPGPIIAYLETGILLVNGTGFGPTGYINNGVELNIKLRSSANYDTTVSTKFYVGNRFATFNITTKSLTGYSPISGCILSTGEKALIQNIFDMLKENYNTDSSTLSDFLFTMQSMLQDDVDLTNNCALAYLLDITDAYIMNNLNQYESSQHKAPNCKIYNITFDSQRSGYTSNNLKRKVYFATREALIIYIDSKNPGDCHINTYKDLPDFNQEVQSGYYTAPNGKIYKIKEKKGTGDTTLYYSPDFIKAKYFENEEDLLRFIDKNNPPIEIRNHEVDKTFEPEIHTAPNGKEYKIYKTDQGFMSYKLMKVQYFDTLEDLKKYIDKNNRY